MRFLIGLLGLILSVSSLEFNLKGAYKTNAKYVYHYEGRIRPSQVPILKNQFIELLVNCTVELHPLSHEKFVLRITKHNFTALVSDPKYTDGPLDYRTFGEMGALSHHLKKPVKFTYSKGLIQKVYPLKDDARFSVNFKKGIINLFHVDIEGKDLETSKDDLFTKNEESVIGICSTSYSVSDYKVISAKRTWKKMGFNITKVININNCSRTDFEVFNTVVPGPNEHQSTNPLKSTATIKYNILGTKSAFKIEEVHAVGMHMLFLTAKDEGAIDSVTDQRLKLIRREKENIKKEEISKLESSSAPEPLLMNVRSFGNIEKVPKFSENDDKNAVELVLSKMKILKKMLPAFEHPSKVNPTHIYMKHFSKYLLHVIHVIRTVKKPVHTAIWDRCSKDQSMKKWILHVYSLCGTQECMKFMTEKLNSLEENLIADYLIASSYNGNPTELMTKLFKDTVEMSKVKSSPYLTKMAYLGATNIIKTFCRQHRCNNTWVDEVLKTALKKIQVDCVTKRDTCRPITHLPATVVLALAENVERPSLFTNLEAIVLDERLPIEIRVKAVLAVKQLVRIVPNRVRILMLRVFRDFSYDAELRSLCFSVLMENPSIHVILHIARNINKEPSRLIRRFVYDKWVAMRYTKLYTPKIDTAVRLALEMFQKARIPPRLGILTHCYHLNWYSRNLTIGALWRHEEIYRENFLPTLITSKLNVTVLGRNITVLEGQLRLQGVQEYLSKLMGPDGLFYDTKPIGQQLKKSGLGKISEKLKDLQKKLPTFAAREEKLKIFSQVKMFDKIFHVNETTMDTPEISFATIFNAGKLNYFMKMAQKLNKGIDYKYSKPFMPVEVIYRMPTLIGVTLTANLTTMVIPVSVSSVKVNTKPEVLSLKSLLSRSINSVTVEAEEKLCAIADVHGELHFRIPNLELGGYMRTTMNVSTHLKANIEYDMKSRTFKTEIETPETVREVLTLKKKAYHYLKVENSRKQTTMKTVEKLDVKKLDKEKSETVIKREKRSLYGDDFLDVSPEKLPKRPSGLRKGGKNLKVDEIKNVNIGNRDTASWSKTTTTPTTMPGVPETPAATTETTTTTSTTTTTTGTWTTAGQVTATPTTTSTTTPTTTPTAIPTITPTTATTPTETLPTTITETTTTTMRTTTRTTTTGILPTTSMSVTVTPTVGPVAPGKPDPEKPNKGDTMMLRIPITIDQLKHVEILGYGKKAPFSEEWTLKMNRKFVNVNGGRVTLSSTPTIFNVTFHGKHRRIVRFFAPGQGYLTIPNSNPCLKTTKQKGELGQYFVLSMTGPGVTKIRAVAHLKPGSVPKEWSIATSWERNEIEEIQRIFQKERMTPDLANLDEEEKVEPSHQTARLVHWTEKDNLVCLTPFERKSTIVHVNQKTSLKRNLMRLAYTHGKCYGQSIGLKLCQHGFFPHPKLNHLPYVYSPLEYRLLLKPVTKKSKVELKVVFPDPASKMLESEVTLSLKGSNKKITLRSKVDNLKMTASVTVVPSGLSILKFSKMCMKVSRKIDDVSFSISFHPSCAQKNIEVSVVSVKDLPRFWMTFSIKYKSAHVPDYILNALKYLTSDYFTQALRSSLYVYPRVNVRDVYKDTSKLDVSLIKNDTLRLHLKTRTMSYLVDEVKLPTIVETLPKGSKEIPLVAKFPFMLKPHCLHRNRSFVTFDKKEYNFTLRGHCEHNLLQICDKRHRNIAVTMKKMDGSMKRILTVLVDSRTFEILPGKEMHDKPIIKLNGSPLPISTRHIIKDESSKRPLITTIWEPETRCITVWHHKYDLIVKLRESHLVTVKISPFFANKTCGLCGNFNGEKCDDFTTPEGSIVNDIRRPTIHHSQIKATAETIFGSSWVVPGLKCDKSCPFERKFVKVLSPGRTCLTNYRILQCANSCKESTKPENVEIPATCVPPSKIENLKKFLENGTKMDLSKATEVLAKISVPIKCRCKC